MRPTADDLKSLWMHAYSRSALMQAAQYVREMDTATRQSPVFRALICAMVVTYARPFTKSQVSKSEQVVPLRDVSPPPELSVTHTNLLSLRNKVIGHVDALPAKGHTDTPNKVLIARDAAGFNLHTVLTDDIAATERENVLKLCAFFVAHCDQKLNELIVAIGDDLPTTVGVYEVLITDPPAEWTQPFSPVVATD